MDAQEIPFVDKFEAALSAADAAWKGTGDREVDPLHRREWLRGTARRLAVLLGGEPVWVSSSIERTGLNSYSTRLVAFTASTVAHGTTTFDSQPALQCSWQLDSVSRRSLVSLGTSGMDNRFNAYGHEWLPRLSAHYSSGAEVTLDASMPGFLDLASTLAKDLTAP